MGTEFTPPGDLHGFLVPDARVTRARVVSKTDATVPSVYTQAGPRTGVPEADQDTALVLLGTGDQGEDGDLELRTLRAGGVGQERGGFGWRDVEALETTSQYKGWDGPQIVSGWETLAWTTVAVGAEPHPHVIRLASGRLLALYNTSILGVVQISRYEPTTGAWTAVNLSTVYAGATYLPDSACLLQLPSGRVLAFVRARVVQMIDVYYSDNEGTTWAAYSYVAIQPEYSLTTITLLRLRAAYSAGEVLLMVGYTPAGGGAANVAIYASTDAGQRFEEVIASWGGESVVSFDVLPVASGGFLITYVDTAPALSSAYVRRIGSAFTSPLSVSRVIVSAGSDDDLGCWRDEDGRIFALLQGEAASDGVVGRLRYSGDEGDTWAAYGPEETISLHQGAAFTNRFARWSVATTAGRTAIVTRWTAAGSSYDTQSVAVIWMGGWSSHTAPQNANLITFRDADHVAWGDRGVSAIPAGQRGGLWLPATLPTNVDWTTAGAGSEAFVGSAELEVTTAVGQTRDYLRNEPDDAIEALFLEIRVDIDAGDGSTAAEEIALKARVSNASSYSYEFRLDLAASGYRIFDINGAAYMAAAVAFDLTTAGHIRVIVDRNGACRTWHARAGHARNWTAGSTGTLTDTAGAAAAYIRWGHTGAAANVSRWALVGYCFYPGRWVAPRVALPGAGWTNPDDLHSRSWSGLPLGVADAVRIAGLDGGSRAGETFRVGAAYDYPLAVAHPEIDPSPRSTWRTTADEVEVRVVYDLTSLASGGRFLNHSIGAFLLGTNVQSFFLEYWTGAAWAQIAEARAYDSWDSLAYLRDGDVVYPDTGVNHAALRYMHYGQHVGGHFRLDANTVREIVEHSEGTWRDDATKRPWVRLRDITDAEPASGTGRIWSQNFGAVAHQWNTDARYIRLRIPAHVTAEGYYEVGQIVIGHVVALGWPYSRGRVVRHRPRTDIARWSDGSSRATRLGPVQREVSFGWGDGVDASAVQVDTPDPSYLTGSAAGLPVAARHDAIRLMEGLLTDRGGALLPVLYLPRIPRGAGPFRIDDREEIVWGRLESETSRQNILGEEGRSEVDRLDNVTLVELV